MSFSNMMSLRLSQIELLPLLKIKNNNNNKNEKVFAISYLLD
jgi:hypothetical protein